jgi:hypothetical protein
MNFLNTVTSELQAQAALKSIANAEAEKVWQEDYAKFCDKRTAFINDCIEAGLDIDYPIQAQSYPDPMPDYITITTTVTAFGFTLRVSVVAGQVKKATGPVNSGERYAYAVGCWIDMSGASKHTCIADPDAQSLHDALVQASKASLVEVL